MRNEELECTQCHALFANEAAYDAHFVCSIDGFQHLIYDDRVVYQLRTPHEPTVIKVREL